MSGWVLLTLGTLLAAVGTMLAVGTAAVSRLELSRWVAERLSGAALATTLLSAPGRVLGTANALATVGTIIAALGLSAVVSVFSLPRAVMILLAFSPVLLLATWAIPRAVGRRWAKPIMRAAAPSLERAAQLARHLVPARPTQYRGDPTVFPRGGEPDDRFRADELAVVAGLIAFTERPVREVMTPRTEIVAVAEGAHVGEVATIFTESGYSRIPVYRESLDQIVGMIHAFDVLKAGRDGTLPLRPVTIVPGSRRCADLLLEMQRERRQFAVILDEFGGTAGIATLEDLLEELIGEIFDEYDDAAAPQLPDIELVEVDGSSLSEDLAARFGVTFPVPAETVSGLLSGALGRIARAGERVLLAGLEFDVLRATPTRVERVVVRRAGVMAIPTGLRTGPRSR